MRTAFTGFGLAILLAALPAFAADLAKGLAAVERQDWASALAEFKPLAERGDSDAEVNLGNLYMKGYGVEQDYRAAFRWYLKAAEQGQPVAQGKLGLMHYYGLGMHENHEEAARWFQEAARNGDPDAASVLASLYAVGDGVELDRPEAYLWYSLAAERGHPNAKAHRQQLADEMSPAELRRGLDKLAAWQREHRPAATAKAEMAGPAPKAAARQGKAHPQKKGERGAGPKPRPDMGAAPVSGGMPRKKGVSPRAREPGG
jgi:TPR repeat protein